MKHQHQPSFSTFLVVWLGQVISLLGSGLSSFALALWVYQQSGSALALGISALAAAIPRLLLSPLAGVLVDRSSRRLVMLLSDAAAGLVTLCAAVLFFSGQLQVWHVYLLSALGSAANTFQWPAYSAATATLVTKDNLGRANGLIQLGRAGADILSPALAGVLLLSVGIPGILWIDFATFLIAALILLVVRFPELQTSTAAADSIGASPRHSVRSEAAAGWQYIRTNPGLTGLLGFVAIFSFLWGMVGVLLTPLVLSFGSPETLGNTLTIAGTGMLVGGLVMSTWGGPRRRIRAVIGFELLSGLCFVLIGLRPLAWLVGIGAFCAHFTIAMIDGSNKSIWQEMVPQELQGRVFAVWQMVTHAASPLAYLTAGLLVDHVFAPMQLNGWLAELLGGAAIGRGIGLLFVLMGLVKSTTALACWLFPAIRNVETGCQDERLVLQTETNKIL